MKEPQDTLDRDIRRHLREEERQDAENERICAIAHEVEEHYAIRLYRKPGTALWVADLEKAGETFEVGSEYPSLPVAFFRANEALGRACMREAQSTHTRETNA